MMQISAAKVADLAGCHAIDESGSSRVLGSYWEDRRAALIFVRHFG